MHQMIFRLPLILCLAQSQWEEELGKEVENLDPTEDGEASEEAHRASNKPNSTDEGHLKSEIFFDYIMILTQQIEDTNIVLSLNILSHMFKSWSDQSIPGVQFKVPDVCPCFVCRLNWFDTGYAQAAPSDGHLFATNVCGNIWWPNLSCLAMTVTKACAK